MDNALTYACWYVTAVNATTFTLCAADKLAAKRGWGRVPEKTLFLLAALGGSPGLWLGMYLFRHKTRNRSFVLGVPVILALQLAAMWLVLRRMS